MQHLLFCPRQCALIHVERVWADNDLTVEGSFLHQKVDETGPRSESRGDVRIARGLALLFHDAASAAEVVGLDPAIGFLHRDKPGRLGLALDLMEEFRPFFGDRLVLSLINKKQLKASGFHKSESGAVLMDEETRKTVLATYQKRKQEEITHPFLEEKTTVGLLLHLQARLLARHLRGELDAYPPFFWK
ncbi:MAG: CRISPR-associated endonuclease Cas1 [bacterium]|nr:CRISPR-associated endonuclease Cas1 [bacterium]